MLTEEVERLINQVEDITEEFGLSYEEKMFLLDALVAFFGGEDPSWDEISGEITDYPKVKEAIKKYFKLNPLQMSEIELQ
ncbi:MAG: hypothetical protein HYT27_01430 [Parcubacteria group bacterium]|nr:hypothetical protein [Parcubacteria group bacterium]